MMDTLLLPQELLFNISEYGQVPEGLTPEYIEQSVRNIDPNFDWSKEFTLEYLRSRDGLYREVGDVLSLIPVTSINEIQLKPGRQYESIITVPIEGIRQSTIDGIISSHQGSYIQGDKIHIPIDVSIVDPSGVLDIRRAMYLAHPRTDLVSSEDVLSLNKDDMEGEDLAVIRYNYPWLLNTMEKRGLPGAFPRWFREIPTDLEIIQAILALNPQYNLGDLLAWIKSRAEICNRAETTAMYRLISEGNITAIEQVDRSSDPQEKRLIFYGYPDPIMEYLENAGVKNPSSNTGPPLMGIISEGGGYVMKDFNTQLHPLMQQIARSVVRDFLASRMCLTAYTPRY